MKTIKNIILAFSMLIVYTSVYAQLQTIDNMRPYDQKGANMFETSKTEPMPYDGLRLKMGAGFTQQFQMLDHSNTADPKVVAGVDANKLANIGNNFNNATANLNIDVQLEKGVRVSLVTYLSARHHQEAWVKGGYIQFDQLPFFPWGFVEDIMSMTTIKIGHMEINYGDAHFRRTDNGNAIWNPFVGNLMLDAFTTEIGTEIYLQKFGFLGMVALTNGEIKGDVTAPEKKTGSLILKGGYDGQINEDLRVRLTGSYYTNERAQTNSLYAGDRAGSRYYYVMENTAATATAQFKSGLVDPSFKTDVQAFVINPFVKFMGLEIFGVYEVAKGKNSIADLKQREVTQIAFDGLYKFDVYGKENVFVGGRYNTVSGQMVSTTPDVDYSVTRMQFVAGWYFTPNVLAKIEYVTQEYKDFPKTDIRNGGKFDGLVFEASIGF